MSTAQPMSRAIVLIFFTAFNYVHVNAQAGPQTFLLLTCARPAPPA